jgi:hypothetical protein
MPQQPSSGFEVDRHPREHLPLPFDPEEGALVAVDLHQRAFTKPGTTDATRAQRWMSPMA